MDKSIIKINRWELFLLLFLWLVVILWSRQLDAGLQDLAIYSGWLLAILTLFLAVYNLRKKITSLPIGRAWYWRKLHSFTGWIAVAVFLVHAGATPPIGTLHLVMWWLYVTMLLTGLAGLWFSLALPSRIAPGRERLQLERIPVLREAQYRHAERVILEATRDGAGEPLAAFHKLHLLEYLAGPQEQFRHCFNGARAAEGILQELNDIGRYIGSNSRHQISDLREIIETKNELDRQYALQNLLRKWTYFHVASNYVSWALIIIHVLLVYTFRGEYGL